MLYKQSQRFLISCHQYHRTMDCICKACMCELFFRLLHHLLWLFSQVHEPTQKHIFKLSCVQSLLWGFFLSTAPLQCPWGTHNWVDYPHSMTDCLSKGNRYPGKATKSTESGLADHALTYYSVFPLPRP